MKIRETEAARADARRRPESAFKSDDDGEAPLGARLARLGQPGFADASTTAPRSASMPQTPREDLPAALEFERFPKSARREEWAGPGEAQPRREEARADEPAGGGAPILAPPGEVGQGEPLQSHPGEASLRPRIDPVAFPRIIEFARIDRRGHTPELGLQLRRGVLGGARLVIRSHGRGRVSLRFEAPPSSVRALDATPLEALCERLRERGLDVVELRVGLREGEEEP